MATYDMTGNENKEDKFSKENVADVMRSLQSLGGLPASPSLIEVYTARLYHLSAVQALQHADEPPVFLEKLQAGKQLAPSTIMGYIKPLMGYIDVLSRRNTWHEYFNGDREAALRGLREITNRLNKVVCEQRRSKGTSTQSAQS